MRILVSLEEIKDSGHWDDFCTKYGYNPWCLNEGLASYDDEVYLKSEDAKLFGLLDDLESLNPELSNTL